MESQNSEVPKYIIVVGASAGGLTPVIELTAQLTPQVDAAFFVVLHHSRFSYADLLIQRIQKLTPFTCKIAEHEEPVKSRHIYIAVADKHLVLQEGKIVLGEGPAENRWRPSIDVLFRSAAAAYNSRVIGIILTGLLHDGTAGMVAIKRCGGTTIVQDPAEAEYPDMPMSVLNNMEVDYCLPLAQIGTVLIEKTKNGAAKPAPVPEDIKVEAGIAARMATNLATMTSIGEKSNYNCPECSGGLWEMVNDEVVRYRCHTGHVFLQDELLIRQTESLENTLWVALRILEERKVLLQKMVEEEKRKGWERSSRSKAERVAELETHVIKLKEILFHTKKSDLPVDGWAQDKKAAHTAG